MMNVAQVGCDGRDHGFGKPVHDIADLVKPAALVTRAGKHLVQGFPEAERAVTNRKFRGDAQAPRLEIDQQFTPVLCAFADTDLKAEQFLPAFRGWRR
jgi:hypothetical protein